MRTWQRRTIPTVLALIMLGMHFGIPVAAQDVDEAATGLLAQASLDSPLEGEQGIWFGRLTLGADGTIPDLPASGPVLIHVESGLVTVSSETHLQGLIAGERIADVQPQNPYFNCSCQQNAYGWTGSLTLAAGQSTLVPAGSPFGMTNHGQTDARALVLAFLPAGRLAAGIDGSGVTGETLAIAEGFAGSDPLVLGIERVSGTEGHGGGPGSVELGTVETGSPDVALSAGTAVQWGPTTSRDAASATAIEEGVATTLDTGAAYAVIDGGLMWSAGGEGATIIRATVAPGS
jgi:hypothetical protein